MSNGTTTTRMSGWIEFAAVMMIISGMFEIVSGLVAIFKPSTYFVTSSTTLFIMSYNDWGLAHLVIGGILILSAMALLAGKLWGRIIAIFLAITSALANFAFIRAYPLWSIIIIILDILIIYAVASYGNENS